MNFSDFVGKTFSKVENQDTQIIFTETTGQKIVMYHSQECCESVYVDDISGELSWLENSIILSAEESSSDIPPDVWESSDFDDRVEWTFYRITTAKGLVVIRWYGSSNGYYSTSVSVEYVN